MRIVKIGLQFGVLFALIIVLQHAQVSSYTLVILAIAAIVLIIYFLPTLLRMSRGMPWGWTLFFNILVGWTVIGHIYLLLSALIDVWQFDGDARQSARIAESKARILAEMRKQSQKSET